MPIAVAILIGLFALQRHGTATIGKAFGPVMLLWFLTMALLGVTSLVRHPEVLRALNPMHGILLLTTHGLLGFTQMAMGAVATVVMGHSQDGSLLPMAVLFFFCSIGAIASHRLAMRRHTG